MENLDVLYGWVDDDPEPFRVIFANGSTHYEIRPKPEGCPTWLKPDDPRLLDAMGRFGYSVLDEIPIREDLTAGRECGRCPRIGPIEVHHTFPREAFGDACDDFPTLELCPECHTWTHEQLEAYGFKLVARLLRSWGRTKLADEVMDNTPKAAT